MEAQMEGSTFFFSLKAHDANSTGALRGRLCWETDGERETEGDAPEKVVGVCVEGCAVV